MKDAGEETRKSIVGFLTTWVVLETLCFLVIPYFVEPITFDSLQGWLPISVILGVAGSFIGGFASGGLTAAASTVRVSEQQRTRMVSGALGFIGFLGVVFPLALAGHLFFQAVSQTDWDELFNESGPPINEVIN